MNYNRSALLFIIIAVAVNFLLNEEQPSSTAAVSNNIGKPQSYEAARTIFWQQLYNATGETLYCAVPIKNEYDPTINIEHVFPMSWVAWTLKCGKRSECRENSPRFNIIEADMHNLFPARADINKARSSHPYGMVDGEKRQFGQCDFEIDYGKKQVEPRASVRGDIARAMFYMADKYQLEIRSKQKQLLQNWMQSDPVSPEEQRRNHLIHDIQGNYNPYIGITE